jgi:hypothetical protein
VKLGCGGKEGAEGMEMELVSENLVTMVGSE